MMQWMRESLFDVIGMNAQPEFDASGLFYGSALIYASARDFAKFGLLYLRDGMWDGQRVLPEGWVDFARTRGQERERRHLRRGLVGSSGRKATGVRIRCASIRARSATRSARRASKASTRWSCRRRT